MKVSRLRQIAQNYDSGRFSFFRWIYENTLLNDFDFIFKGQHEDHEINPMDYFRFFKKAIYPKLLIQNADVNFYNLINSFFEIENQNPSFCIALKEIIQRDGFITESLINIIRTHENPVDFVEACKMIPFNHTELYFNLSRSRDPKGNAATLGEAIQQGFIGFDEPVLIDAMASREDHGFLLDSFRKIQEWKGTTNPILAKQIKLDLINHSSPKDYIKALKECWILLKSTDDSFYQLLREAPNPMEAAQAINRLKPFNFTSEINEKILNNSKGIEFIFALSDSLDASILIGDSDLIKPIVDNPALVESFILLSKSNLLLKNNIIRLSAHPDTKLIVTSLKALLAINQHISQEDVDKICQNQFCDWRSDKIPKFDVNKPIIDIFPQEDHRYDSQSFKKAVESRIAEEYHRSIRLMERSTADLALEYTREEKPHLPPFLPTATDVEKVVPLLLQYARTYSQRYLDLLQAYVSIEAKKGIPMIPVDIGQLKLHGFTSTQILRMQPACSIFTNIAADIKHLLIEVNHPEVFKVILKLLTDNARESSLPLGLERKTVANWSKGDFEKSILILLLEIKIEKLLPHKEIDAIELLKIKIQKEIEVTPIDALKEIPPKWSKLLELSKKDLEHQIGCSLTAHQYQGLKHLYQTSVLLTLQQYDKLVELFNKYDSIPEEESQLINKAFFLMHDFGHLSYENIMEQLIQLGGMNPSLLNKGASEDERLLMEIRHRIAGESIKTINSPGTLGHNSLAYLNLLKWGEPDNPEAEFRNRMFFVYMLNHFANEIIIDDKMVSDMNDWLKEHGKGWAMDVHFIESMRNREKYYLPPIFRYGANAVLNTQFRRMKLEEDTQKYYRAHPNISIEEAMSGTADINSLHRSKLSKRELLNQRGEWTYVPNDPRNKRPLIFGTGSAVFDLAPRSSTFSSSTREYLKSVEELGLPVCAGISGTLDQSTTMGGLVGLGTTSDDNQRRYQLEITRLAYLAFMLPGADHTVHEIMQSARTYGLDYVAGPGYEAYVFPPDSVHVKEQLEDLQRKRGSELPAYYFSEAHVKQVVFELTRKMDLSTDELHRFVERLDETFRLPHMDKLRKQLSNEDHLNIIKFFDLQFNNELRDKLLLLEPGHSIRFAKEMTQLPRTVTVIRTLNGEYQLIVETKRKLADNSKDLDIPVARGAIKSGKPSWRLDIPQELFGLTMSTDTSNPQLEDYLQEIKNESTLSQRLAEQSDAICPTQVGESFEKNGKSKITVYSPKALGTLDSVLASLSDNREAKEQLIADLLDGVRAIHKSGFVHQDLKPQNLLVFKDDEGKYHLKITDFGEARSDKDKNAYAAGPNLFQSPEMAYYYTNPYDPNKENKMYGKKYYDKSLGILGCVVIDSQEGRDVFKPDIKNREQFKSPNQSNDIWALGMLIYYIQHQSLPQSMHDIHEIRHDPLLKRLLDIDRTKRSTIDEALNINETLSLSGTRSYEKHLPGQRYYLGINLPLKSEDQRAALGDDITEQLSRMGDIRLRERAHWHLTVGWLENKGDEGTPISYEDYQKIRTEIKLVLEQHQQSLKFQMIRIGNWEGHENIHVSLKEEESLSALRKAISEAVSRVAPHVEFKFSSPHIVVASSKTHVETLIQAPKKYQVSEIDIMYHDDKKGKNIITEAVFISDEKQKKGYKSTFFSHGQEQVRKDKEPPASLGLGMNND